MKLMPSWPPSFTNTMPVTPSAAAVREADARHEVERCNEAAQEQRQEQPDQDARRSG